MTNPILFRYALPDDLSGMVHIYNQAIEEKYCTADTETLTVTDRHDWYNSHSSENYPIVVAEKTGIMVGWYSLSPHRPGRKALRSIAEFSYYVHSDYRGEKIGSQLFEHAIDLGPELGLKNLFAILIDKNRPSIQILEKYGFRQWGHLPEVALIDGEICGQFIYGRKI